MKTTQIYSRREILAAAGSAALGLTALKYVHAAAPKPAADAGFEFALFGDVHYDKTAHHDMTWLAKEHPGDVHQVADYTRISRDITPGLFDEVRAVIATSKVPMPFTAHIGDLVEGLCGTPELAQRQCHDALDLVNGSRLGNPMLLVKGNHDITGPGAHEAFDSILLPAMTSPETRDPKSASFTRQQGNTLFLFFDSYSPSSLDWAEKALESRTSKHLIVMIHQPVVPYNARSNWQIFAKPSQDSKRQRLLTLLGRNRAVVLTGHLHKYSALTRKTDAGPFVQLALCSVIQHSDMQPKDIRAGLDQYNADLVTMEPHFSPSTLQERKELLTAEKPFIRSYDYADIAGYAVLSVQDSGIKARMYNGIGNRFWKEVDLTEMLDA